MMQSKPSLAEDGRGEHVGSPRSVLIQTGSDVEFEQGFGERGARHPGHTDVRHRQGVSP